MIKIVRIIDRLNIGGPAIHVLLLSKYLDPQKYQTILITGHVEEFEGNMEYLASKYNITPVYIPELGRSISFKADFLSLWKILKILIVEQPQIVHTHKSKAGAIGRVAAILARVPIVIHTFHGHVFHSYFGRIKTQVFLQIERILAKFTNTIVTISPQQFKEISGTYKIASKYKFSVVPLGFDFSPLLELSKHKGKLRNKFCAPGEIIVGIVGRLALVKNHSMFLKVAQKVVSKRPQAKFAIIGGGELREDLEQQANALGIASHIVFTGWIQSGAEIYSDLDIVTLTSHNEGTPVTLIEAMFCQKPIVATKVGGVVDLVDHGKNGFLISCQNVEDFAKAVISLIDDKDKCHAFGLYGAEKVRQKYSKERLVGDIENLYQYWLKR